MAKKKSEPKTKPTKESALKYIAAIENETRRADSKVVIDMLKRVTGKKPVMWGTSIVGFGKIIYECLQGYEEKVFLVVYYL